MSAPQFVLASASAARRQLLLNAGVQHFVSPSKFDEDQITLSDPGALVKALSLGKAETVAPVFPNAVVLGCDSVMAFDGEIYGKPETPEDAIKRWWKMRGKVGEIFTGHTLIAPQATKTITRCQVTRVHLAWVSDREIEDYVATGEPMNCAGAFTIDGKGGFFVEKLEGCHTNVIGLSMPMLRDMLGELGYRVTDFWSG
ncbi:septum formation protein maf [Leptolyngbya sp. Heron Island J]|uniref:Maf family protein n=1 Tax=Leptolyngbya sp. Heron Island J TaxID=1385935 RepID=UPI0003B9BC1B|nr:nucleoside triphosphate pyrophosphatase [Leptolyngbya sp. Heron Island J]ESA36813.1 septum formation protein maf [Leptolyngbya sp. Heron Island J]